MQHIRTVKNKATRFLTTGIWRLSHGDLSRPKALLLRGMQILLLTVQGYVRDNCALRASALTFYSLLSIVPVVALAFGIAKGFGLEQRLESQLYQRLAGQEEVVAKIIAFARSLLENTQGGLIAGIGVLLLFWSAIKVLSNIEGTLNDIWKVRSRSFIRKFTDYLTIMIISPLLVIVSSSVTVYITTEVTAMTAKMALLKMADPLIFSLLKLLPFGLIWLLFILIYLVMPNTRVRPISALIAGVIAGTVFQITQGLYIHAQVLLAKYNAIYGSFAALPFFLIWLQLSWMIVLFGAQIAYAHQHVGQHLLRIDYQDISLASQKRIALHVLRRIAESFGSNAPPLTAEQIGAALQLPHGLVAQLLEHLIQSGMVSAVQDPRQEEPGYQPARDIHGITIADVLDAWDQVGRNDLPDDADGRLLQVCQAVETLDHARKQSEANRLIQEI
jgi:membrane protein